MLKRSSYLSLIFALSLTVACGDEETNTSETNNRVDNNGVTVPQGSRLEHSGACEGMANCAVDVTFSSTAALKVRLVDGDSFPVIGAQVEYELDIGTAAGTILTSKRATTDGDGFATVDLQAGQTVGVAKIKVIATNDSTVAPIQFIAGIHSKDSASYRVSFEHGGTANLRDINVFLYDSATTCDAVRADLNAQRDGDPATNPSLSAEYTGSGFVAADGALPIVIFPGLTNGDAYTVAALAQSRDSAEVELAMGCKDGNPAIDQGTSVDVVVPLNDHLPRLKGTYDVTHTINIKDAVCEPQADGTYNGALPSGVCKSIDLLGRLATDPASFLLGNGTAVDDAGIIGLIVDFLPEDGTLGDLKGYITDFLNNDIISGIGRDALNAFFNEWITVNAPEWVRDSIDITEDIYKSISEFKVTGIIRITDEAIQSVDANGVVTGTLQANAMGEKPGKQVWENVIVQWTGDCAATAPASCSERTFSAADLGANQSVVEGYFTGAVEPLNDLENPGYGLAIDPHSLTLDYGILLLAIIEKVVLPSIFGPNVDTLEESIDFLITSAVGGADGCSGLATYVNDEFGGGDTVKNLTENLCNSLISEAGDAVRTYLSENLVLEGEDGFVMSTPAGTPCRIIEPALYAGDWDGKPLAYGEKLGTDMAECKWDVKIAAGDTTIDAEANFHGTRTTF